MTVSPSFGKVVVSPTGAQITGAPQFDRRCQIVVSYPNPKDVKSTLGTALVINETRNDLRVKFKFRKTIVWTPNVGEVIVYNLSPDSRKALQGQNLRVIISAGYGSDLKQVGVLWSRQVNHRREGPDWITKMEGGDGGRAFLYGNAAIGLPANTPYAAVAQQLLGTLGRLSGQSQATLQSAAKGRVFRNGYSSQGRVAEEARFVLKQLGLEHFVVDDEVVVIKKGGTTGEVFQLDSTSGLIGSPEYASPPQYGKPQLLKLKTLLDPLSRPGCVVSLQSASHSGQFRVRDLEHEGDTWGGPWYTSREVQALAGAK